MHLVHLVHQCRYGVDLAACGEPGFRLVPELDGSGSPSAASSRVAVGFKTYMHTPDAEDVLLRKLAASGLREPDVLIVEAGSPWGLRR
jgi:hypothetical protein